MGIKVNMARWLPPSRLLAENRSQEAVFRTVAGTANWVEAKPKRQRNGISGRKQ